jgi:hypothetical protein
VQHSAGPFRALGHRFEVRSADPRAVDTVSALFAAFEDRGPSGAAVIYELRHASGRRPFQLLADGELIHEGIGPGVAIDALIAEIDRGAVLSKHPFVVLHAGAVSWSGAGIVLPAPADHGKSTLVAGLVRAGCHFLSDECAPIDDRGFVLPFPRPLMLSPQSIPLVPGIRDIAAAADGPYRNLRYRLAPKHLNDEAVAGPCRVELIVCPTYVPGAAVEVSAFRAADCLQYLTAQCMNFEQVKGTGIRVLGQLVSSAKRYRLTVGSLVAGVDAILALVRTTAA